MIRNALEDEARYSLVEVMVSIMLLTVAIIPMVSMFDAGLNAATRGSDYDKARALAKKQLETAQSLPYGTVRSNLPNAPCSFDGSGQCESADRTDHDAEFSNFRYTIRKQYVVPNDPNGDGSFDDYTGFNNSGADRGFMRVTVVVGWGGAGFNETTYTTTSLKVR